MTRSPAADTLPASNSRAHLATDATILQPQPPPADLEGRLIANSVLSRMFDDDRPTRIGSYIIIRRIGGGAMGDVFLAHHETLDRKAAIKLVRPAAEDSTIERQRLLREAQVLAQIKHPNVVEVYDAGTHDNRVYLAMQYVAGSTLGAWQQTNPWQAVLTAYLKAGRGLQAVHSVDLDGADRKRDPTNGTTTTPRGLCHRDFKPDNVLIDQQGEVRVADFGLAIPTQRREPGPGGVIRSLDLRLTADASVVGTPLYIAPEQLTGSPGDARSDQYSYCVALYEALYHQHPYYAPRPATRASEIPTDSGGPGHTAPHFALFEAILGAPLRPAPRTSKVPRRLYTILARGLDREPNNRYPSMAALLAALEHDPKRRPLQILGVGLAIGVIFGISMYANKLPAMCSNIEQETTGLWDDARQAQVHSAFLATGADHAHDIFTSLDKHIDDHLKRWSVARHTACDATYKFGTQTHEAHERSMICLDQQLALADRALSELSMIDASTILGIDDRISRLPPPEDCDARRISALNCRVATLGDDFAARVREQIQAAQTAEIAGRLKDAEPLAAIAASAARAHGHPALVVDAHFTLGRILTALGRTQAAQDALRTARHAAEAASCDLETVDLDAYTGKLAAFNPNIAVERGRDAIDTGLAKLERLDLNDPRRRAQLLNDRGLLFEYRDNNYVAAEHDYRSALQLRTHSDLDEVTDQARTLQNLGNTLEKQARHADAITALTDSIDLYENTYGKDHLDTWKPLFNLGSAALNAGDLALSKSALNRALPLALAAFGNDSPDVREIYSALTKLAYAQDDGPAAEKHARAGLHHCPRGTADAKCLELSLHLAYARGIQGHPQDALALREQVFAIARRQSREVDLVDQRIDLAISLSELRRFQDALDHLVIAEANLPDAANDHSRADLALYQGEALLGLSRPEAAIPAFERAQSLGAANAAIRAAATWGLAQARCEGKRDPVEAKKFAALAREYYVLDIADAATAELVGEIDDLMKKPCSPNTRR